MIGAKDQIRANKISRAGIYHTHLTVFVSSGPVKNSNLSLERDGDPSFCYEFVIFISTAYTLL
jgi:hypothetical protein